MCLGFDMEANKEANTSDSKKSVTLIKCLMVAELCVSMCKMYYKILLYKVDILRYFSRNRRIIHIIAIMVSVCIAKLLLLCYIYSVLLVLSGFLGCVLSYLIAESFSFIAGRACYCLNSSNCSINNFLYFLTDLAIKFF